MKNKIIYYLTIDDIQNVANQEVERNLSPIEIKQIIDKIASKINWYDAIANIIEETITIRQKI